MGITHPVTRIDAPSEIQAMPAGMVDRFLSPRILLRIVLYLTFLTYLQTVFFDFAYDDISLILVNPWMASWKNLPTFFTHSFWGFAEFPRPTDYYRPLVMTFLAIIRHTLGSAPGWFHLLVIGVHVLVVYLTYLVARELTDDGTLAAIAAAIFGLHPTKIESVAWISGVSDSLCMVFFLACILVYLRWRKNGARGHVPFSSLVLLLLAMLSKEMAVVVPALIGVYEILDSDSPITERVKSAFRVVVPYALVVSAVLILRFYAMRNFAVGAGYSVHYQYSLYTAPQAVLWYLGKQSWPLPVSLQYPMLAVMQPSFLRFFVPLFAVLVSAIVLTYLLRRSAAGWFLAAWFVLTLAPVLAFGPMLQLHDRHMYAPSVATSIALAYLVVTLGKRYKSSAFPLQASIVAVACIALTVMTVREVRYWSDEITLFNRVVAVAPDRVDAYAALTGAYMDRKDLDNAEKAAMLWTQKAPDAMGGWLVVAEVRRQRQDYDGARQAFQQALHIAKTPVTMAFAAAGLGWVAMEQGDPAESAHWYELAIQGQPAAAMLHDYYGRALVQSGKTAQGQQELQFAQRLRKHQGW